ncbi:MAG: hypothetical protein ABIH34_02495 [Nanoarchaeota archaeon]
MNKTNIVVLIVLAVGVVLAFNYIGSTGALIGYTEFSNKPSWRDAGNGIISDQREAVSVGGMVDWVELAAKLKSEEIAMVTIDAKNNVNAQIWDGNAWGSLKELTKTSKLTQHAADVIYESQSGDALAVFVDMTGDVLSDKTLHYATWNGKGWSAVLEANNIGASPTNIDLASNPLKDEILCIGVDAAADTTLEVWDGNKWGQVYELTKNSYPGTRPYAAAYEHSSGEAIIVYTSRDQNDPRVRYRVYVNGVLGEEQFGPALSTYGRLYRLIPDPKSDEIVMMVRDEEFNTYISIWDGNRFHDKGIVATEAQGLTFMGMDGAYQTLSGNAILAYADNSFFPKYRIWDGKELSVELNMPGTQNIVRWIEMDANPADDELLVLVSTRYNNVDALFYDGSWKIEAVSTSNSNAARGGIAVAYEQQP